MRLPQSHHRNPASLPDWRRVGLGLVAVLLMSLQGAAALAHRNAHYQEFEPAYTSPTAVAGSDAPIPGNSPPAAQCKLCQSSIEAVSILPGTQAGLSMPFTVSIAARPVLHQARPRAPPGSVWRVRGPPPSLHA
ncbi:hypothetical protein [Maricaulis sp.]|uniref:hypothetical protein n=1 Tax=Maricaulis sp. TaxID=1486257 RepID=UPI003A920542